MESGIRIMNLEASDILKNNLNGESINKDYRGVFTDSLLLDKLKKMGLNISKNEATRDIINVQFNYGYTPKEAKDITKIKDLESNNNIMLNTIKELENKKKLIIKRADKKPIINEIKELKNIIRNNKKSIKDHKQEAKKLCLNIETIREKLYKEGFVLDFYKKDKTTKEYVLDESIEYMFWFRTPSKSKIGDAMFVNKKLYSIKTWQRMGLELPEGEEGKIVEMAAYESLTSSHKEDEIIINPENILVISDIDSYFSTNCAIVYTDADGECQVKHEIHKVKNTLFDGQCLLEDSLYKGNNSIMLLRHHMFKACGFRSFIKRFMMDWCNENGKDYNTYTVKDRYGNNILVKNILMITTENAMKWEKFQNASYELWKQKVNEDNNIFGICKVDHKSKYGEYQRMSYQMIQTLDVDSPSEIQELAQDTITYVNNMKDNNDLYVNDYLVRNISEVNPNAMIIGLYNQNKKFAKSEFFRDYKKKDISKYVETLRNGKLLGRGDNLTIVGNPYIMLLHSVGAVPVIDGILDENYIDITLPIANEGDDQYISVYTSRFDNNEYLCAFRSPHNSPNNIGFHKVFKHDYMKKYFNFTDNIMAVNMIQTEEQDLKNGEDQDSDFCYVTNNSVAINSAKKVFRKFPCIVNGIKKDDRKYKNTIENLAKIDNELAKSKYDIGLSSNLAMLAMSWYWNDKTEELADIVCIMSVLAQCAIDNSKRKYNVNIAKEIKRISNLECMKHTTNNNKGHEIKAKPNFWKHVSDKVKEESLVSCNCPMNYLQDALDVIKVASKYKDTIDNVKFIKIIEGKADDKQIARIEKIVKKYDDEVKKHNDLVKKGLLEENEDKWTEEQEILQYDVVNYITKLKVKEKTMQILVSKALSKKGMNRKYKRKLLNTLYKSHKETFLAVFKV